MTSAPPAPDADRDAGRLRNWSGTLTYSAHALHAPRSVADVQRLVAGAAAAGRRVRALGSRHSFNDAADTDGDLLDLTALREVPEPELDARAGRVRVAAGTTYGELAPWLHARGWALGAMASLPHITVGGAVATATHGSGDASRCLSAAVAALDLVGADGELRHLDRSDVDFAGAVVALGALGVVVAVELDVEPTYAVRQDVYEHLPWEALAAHHGEITALGQSTSVFTRWGEDDVAQVWVKQRVPEQGPLAGVGSAPRELFGARAADADRHPLPGQSAATCTPQRGVPGPWFQRLPHFRLEHVPSNGAEAQAEYLLPRAALPEAVAAVRPLAPRLDPLLIMSELRTVAADDLWLSPAHGRDVVAVHFTFSLDVPAVLAVLPAVEEALVPLGAVPHWGKLSTLRPALLAERFARWDDAAALFARADPRGVFAGPLTDRVGLTGR